ncbi:MAG: hypothetical protein AAFY66_07280 [Pseudomonadota bacterium]
MLDADALELLIALALGGALWLGWALRGVWEAMGSGNAPVRSDASHKSSTDPPQDSPAEDAPAAAADVGDAAPPEQVKVAEADDNQSLPR